jgi:hypothetical protein
MKAGFLIDSIWSPFGEPTQLGFLAYPVTLLWFIGVTNAFNLTDGLDGLLSSVGLASVTGCAVVGLSVGMVGTPALALALAGALAGFLPWNWHRARMFLGDSGSLLVGFAAAALAIKVSRYGSGGIAFHVLLSLCAIPAIETFLTLARRYVTGRPFFSPDQGHVHHVLVHRKGLTVPRTVIALAGAQILFSGMAVFSRVRLGWYALIPNAVLLVAACACIRWLGYVELGVIRRHVLDRLFLYCRRRHLSALAEIARGGELVRGAKSTSELKDRLWTAMEEGRFDFVALELSGLGAQVLADEPTFSECRNAEAVAYLAGRNGRPGWLFSVPRRRPDDHVSRPTGPRRPDDLADPTGEASDVNRNRQAPGSSGPSKDRTLRRCAGVTFAVHLLTGDGRYGRLVCHRRDDLRSPAPAAKDVQQYLAEPLAEVMERLGRLQEKGVPERATARELRPA